MNTHPHVNNLSYEENIEEIEKSNDKIEKITGTRTKIYRAPYGEYNDTVIKSAEDKGYYTIQWNLDTLDYTGLTGEEMWQRLDEKIKAGDIILSHNGTKHTADSLDMILKNIKAKGLEVVKVSELIYQDGYTIDSNGTQIKNND
jgi:peptidoglycan/xylan/chitin deacetylase (PgdA/CDA1 family)